MHHPPVYSSQMALYFPYDKVQILGPNTSIFIYLFIHPIYKYLSSSYCVSGATLGVEIEQRTGEIKSLSPWSLYSRRVVKSIKSVYTCMHTFQINVFRKSVRNWRGCCGYSSLKSQSLTRDLNDKKVIMSGKVWERSIPSGGSASMQVLKCCSTAPWSGLYLHDQPYSHVAPRPLPSSHLEPELGASLIVSALCMSFFHSTYHPPITELPVCSLLCPSTVLGMY